MVEMKKAYVKPVYMAELFEVTECVATCPVTTSRPHLIVDDDYLCFGGDKGHQIDATDKNTYLSPYWDSYANADDSANLFTSSSFECDFLWNDWGTNVFGWSTDGTADGLVSSVDDRKNTATEKWNLFDFGEGLLRFFTGGSNADNNQHGPGIPEEGKFFS